jgi:hypothetical protein
VSSVARAVHVAEGAGVQCLDGREKRAVHWNRIVHALAGNVERRGLLAVGVCNLMTSRQYGP